MARADGRQARRLFLTTSWRWLRWLTVLPLLYPVGRFIAFYLPAKPRKIVVRRKLLAGDFHVDHDFILFAGSEGERPWAVSRRCTHLGCRVAYQAAVGQIICPCHHSRFNIHGKLLAGPARKDLAVYPVTRLHGGGKAGYVVTV